MKMSHIKGLALALVSGLLLAVLGACGASQTFTSEVINPEYELEFRNLAETDVEIREVANATLELSNNEAYCVDFENENMALMVPLSLLAQAEEKGSTIAMRYQYPAASDDSEGNAEGITQSISFYLPYISEYELYFPGIAAEEVSLMVADVVVSQENSEALRKEIDSLRCTTTTNDPVYATQLYLVNTSGTEPVAIKLDSIEESLIMREVGIIDESALNARLYVSSEGDVYKPQTTVYYGTYLTQPAAEESSPEATAAETEGASEDEGVEQVSSFVETTLYGSFVTTQGQLGTPSYKDVEGHYAEGAIMQMQLSHNMAYAITKGEAFEPDEAASIDDVLNAQGSFSSQPLMSAEAYALTEANIIEYYGVDQMFDFLINPANASEVKGYVARVPYQTAEVYEALGLEGKMDIPLKEGIVLNSRISVALLGIGAFRDDAPVPEVDQLLASEPTAAEADTWLTGITDVSPEDPLRPYAALAVKYGLLYPNSAGELNLYEPISRADLCLMYANLNALFEKAVWSTIDVEGYGQTYLYIHGMNNFFNMEGTWQLLQATRADGSAYTTEEVNDEQASFVFTYGESLESWTGEEYEARYVFCIEDQILTLYYADGQHEALSLNNSLSELTYAYLNDADPEFSGETYVFSRMSSSVQ